MRGRFTPQLERLFCLAAVTVWLAFGWPVVRTLVTDGAIRGVPVPDAWLVPFGLFGASAIAAMAWVRDPRLFWWLVAVELACVVAMTAMLSWAGMAQFLLIPAWQVATVTTPRRAVAWVGIQTAAVVATLAQALDPDICWILVKSLALQLLLVFTAQALRREARTAQALARSNDELQAAQAIVAATARDAERLRISRELHDAWGHELTALGLQLEIASHVGEASRVQDHVAQARGLSRTLLAKVRDVVATLREAERCDLAQVLKGFAAQIPVPAIHVDVAPGVRVEPAQVHALVRCAQEAVTNAVKHSNATNLWLSVDVAAGGIRLVARDDGRPRRTAPDATGSGLRGMRERLEQLGGDLAVRTGLDRGFTVEAWLPSAPPQR